MLKNKYITTRHSRFTGDLFDDYARFGIEIQDEVSQLFRKINAPYGKFAIYGNHEYSGLDTNFYETILEAADFTVLKTRANYCLSHTVSPCTSLV